MSSLKAFTIAATRSGAGKTTLTLGILAALTRRGVHVQPFKCGPDFIDPTLHKSITNKTSYNLDLKMMGTRGCQRTFYNHAVSSDISVVEGVMGLYDGGSASTASLSKLLGIPVILIIDAQSSAESSVAVLNGFESYDPEVQILGVIFNKIGSPRHKSLIDAEAQKKSSIPVIGYMPRDLDFQIAERHLGLHMGNENPLSTSALDGLTRSIEKNLDIDQLLTIETTIETPPRDVFTAADRAQIPAKTVMAVASDEAFCFYYKENFELFERAGFAIKTFSPLSDRKIPAECQIIYLGGGYPELFAQKLSQNRAMLDNLREMHDRGVTIYAECGGFMYLCDALVDMSNEVHSMVGLFPFRAVMNKRLRRLGYRQARLLENSFMGEADTRLFGHEFHYSHMVECDREDQAAEISRLYKLDNNSQEGYHIGSATGSYIHLHFGRNPEIVYYMHDYISSKNR